MVMTMLHAIDDHHPNIIENVTIRQRRLSCRNIVLLVLLLGNVVVMIVSFLSSQHTARTSVSDHHHHHRRKTTTTDTDGSITTSITNNNNQHHHNGWDYRTNPLGIPPGEGIALPSIREFNSTVDQRRKIYGGYGDKAHLGGFTEIDTQGISPAVWKYMITSLGIHSMIDIGCGRGISTSWFYFHNISAICIEGSHDAIEHTVIPQQDSYNMSLTNHHNRHHHHVDFPIIIEHDYSRGPYWTKQTYDAVWGVEFLEHVGIPNHFHYITTFRKAAIILVTSSKWGGWHHVEIHNDTWWIRKYRSYGFLYSESLTQTIRGVAQNESTYSWRRRITLFNGKHIDAQHVRTTVKVFINPMVASLPEHAHLFPQHGCYASRGGPTGIVNRICGTGKDGALETPLPMEYWPIPLTPEMDIAWDDWMKQHIPVKNST